MYVPPVVEILKLAEVEHNARLKYECHRIESEILTRNNSAFVSIMEKSCGVPPIRRELKTASAND